MDTVEDLQYAIEWYRSVVPVRSDRPRTLTADPGEAPLIIDQIQKALRPLALSTELVWFWSTWGPGAVDALFDVVPTPRPTTAQFALQSWQIQAQGEFPGMPRNLFPVAHDGHGFLLADLTAAAHGGAAPLYYYDFDAYQLHYPSLASMFRTVAATLESLGITVPTDRSQWAGEGQAFSSEAIDATRRAALTAAGMDDQPSEITASDQRRWPEAWRMAHGLSQADLEPRGATHTVAQLVDAAARAPLTARLHGHCRGYVGSIEVGGEWVGIRSFTDATGTIDVLQPVDLQAIGVTGDVLVEVEIECIGPFGARGDTSIGACDLMEASASNEPDRMSAAIDALIAARYPDVENLPRIRRMVAVN